MGLFGDRLSFDGVGEESALEEDGGALDAGEDGPAGAFDPAVDGGDFSEDGGVDGGGEGDVLPVPPVALKLDVVVSGSCRRGWTKTPGVRGRKSRCLWRCGSRS